MALPSSPSGSTEAPVVFTQTVEGVIRALGRAPTDPEKRALRELGIDLDRPLEPAYPAVAFAKAVEFVARARSPGLSEAEAYRELGERFFEGYTQTLIGRATGQVLKVIGVRRSLARMERSFRNGNNYMRSHSEDLGSGRVRLYFDHILEQPEYLRGIVLSGGRYVGAKAFVVDLVESGPNRCVLEVRWDES